MVGGVVCGSLMIACRTTPSLDVIVSTSACSS
jgi:hypothetical protein